MIQLLLQIWHIRERRDYHQKNSVTGIVIGCRYETSKGLTWAFQVALVVKNPPAHAGDSRDSCLIPGLERSPRGGCGNPFQYTCLENPMDRGAWCATVHGITKRVKPKLTAKQQCFSLTEKCIFQFLSICK